MGVTKVDFRWLKSEFGFYMRGLVRSRCKDEIRMVLG